MKSTLQFARDQVTAIQGLKKKRPEKKVGPRNAAALLMLDILRYGAEEVYRQEDGPMQVWSMVDAWEWWRGRSMRATKVTVTNIAWLGTRVHPWQNSRGFRAHEIRVSGRLGAYHHEIRVQVQRWIDAVQGKDLFEFQPMTTSRNP